MTKPDYIKNVEEKEGFLSTFELYSTMPSTTKIDNNKNLNIQKNKIMWGQGRLGGE